MFCRSHIFLFVIAFFFLSMFYRAEAQRTVRYDLHVTDTTVNYTGKNRKAIAINGQIPAPKLEFTEGDTAEIYVHNHMHHETSVHWHGIILPNEQDGVPYLTTKPTLPDSTHLYKFVLKQSGTYWYHSHTMLQEQVGMYGAFIIYKKGEKKEKEHTIVLSDWTDENPHQVERSLHNATDFYGIKKRATQDYYQAVKEGYLGTKFVNEFKRMHAMDVSDVYYDRFLLNGVVEEEKKFNPGDKVRLRVINGSASTYFWLTYGGGKITVVASDGEEVVPVEVDRLIVGVSETYDVIVEVPPEGTAHEFLATSEDRIGRVSLWLGSGKKQLAEPLGTLRYFEGMKMMNDMMTVNMDMKDMGMKMGLQKMDMNAVMYPEISPPADDGQDHSMHGQHSGAELVTLNYAMLKAPRKTTLPASPVRTLHFELTGNMNRYVWTIDDKKVSEVDKIMIRKGEITKIIMTNNSMMRHPMHLHGHYFRVLNGQGEYSPLKNVIDIMPMETDTIEFYNSEEGGDWFFHCHILYHMMSGMGRIFSYEDGRPNPQVPDPEKALRKTFADDRRFYAAAEISLESNGSDGELSFASTRWLLQTEWRVGLNSSTGYESESHIGRYLDRNQFLIAYTGWDYRYRTAEHAERNIFGQRNTKDDRGVICAGFIYTLPWFIVADFRIDHTGNLRLQITRDDIPLSARLRGWGTVNSDMEYSAGLRYTLTKYFSLSTHYDSDMGFGAGLTVTY